MESSSGEAITALEMAKGVVELGGSVHFLASRYAARIIGARFPDRIVELRGDGLENRQLWDNTIRRTNPDVVVFADYPLLFFSSGVASIEPKSEWAASLAGIDARLVSLDHIGYAQKSMRVFFGPPHITSQSETIVQAPAGMEVLLPCPLNAPSGTPQRRGQPFRAWSAAQVPADRVLSCRGKYLGNRVGTLVLHLASTWAVNFAKAYRLPYYRFLPSILDFYLGDLEPPVTVISLNGGAAAGDFAGKISFINLPALPADELEACMLASDLVLGENRISVSLGKAALRGIPVAVLQNSFELSELMELTSGKFRNLLLKMEKIKLGSIFRHQVFPIWSKEDLDQLGLFEENPLADCLCEIELYRGESTRQELQSLLGDENRRLALRQRQEAYTARVNELDSGAEVLSRLA